MRHVERGAAAAAAAASTTTVAARPRRQIGRRDTRARMILAQAGDAEEALRARRIVGHRAGESAALHRRLEAAAGEPEGPEARGEDRPAHGAVIRRFAISFNRQ